VSSLAYIDKFIHINTPTIVI